MKAQALGDDSRSSYMKGRRTLEINPRHPLIKALKDRLAENGEEDVPTKDLATLVYETALVESGFQSDDPKAFASRMYSLMGSELNADMAAEMEEEPEEEEEAAAPAAEEDEEEGEGEEDDSAPTDKSEL